MSSTPRNETSYAQTRPARRSRSTKLRLLITLAVVAAIGAGCSKAPSRSGADSTDTPSAASSGTGVADGSGDPSTATRTQAVKFAECMRSNGASTFPDPDASGDLTLDGVANGSGVDTSTATFEQAVIACKSLEPSGFTGHKRSAQEQEQALEFAQCMRDKGVNDFADPTPDGPLINIDGSNPDLKAAVDAALPKCQDQAAGAGATAP